MLPNRRPSYGRVGVLLGLVAAAVLGCDDLFDSVLHGPEMCAEGVVIDEAGDPLPDVTVALVWRCSGEECTSSDCSRCSGAGSEHEVTDSNGYFKVTDRVLDGDCGCSQCMWDVEAARAGYRVVEDDRLGEGRSCSRCEVRNFRLEPID